MARMKPIQQMRANGKFKVLEKAEIIGKRVYSKKEPFSFCKHGGGRLRMTGAKLKLCLTIKTEGAACSNEGPRIKLKPLHAIKNYQQASEIKGQGGKPDV